MRGNRYKAAYNAWAINWKETNKGSVGLITANAAIDRGISLLPASRLKHLITAPQMEQFILL